MTMFLQPKPKKVEGIEFEPTREGFKAALSRRESSSNLLLPHSNPINLKAGKLVNNYGFVGYFQFGEDALIDCGYYNPRYKNSDKSSANNWQGSWTGKNGIYSLEQFKNSPEVQVKAFNTWVDILCNRLRNANINEFYGKTINGVEITESGCIAAAHLKGTRSVLNYLTSNGRINGRDAFNTGVAEYIDLLAYYDLETCCRRKIYITVKKDGNSVPNIEVSITTVYPNGKYYSRVGETKNIYLTNEEGKILAFTRHPGAKITITVNGKSSEIIQKNDSVQSYTVDISGSIRVSGQLEEPSSPQVRPQPNKSEQDLRREQSQSTANIEKNNLQDVSFNISIVEGDTKKPITNIRYYIIYKGRKKEHRTNGMGVENNITATEGEDIEICVAGKDNLQPIYHFIVNKSQQGKTINVPLPVKSFRLKVKDSENVLVKNTYFMIFYRGHKIIKQTNAQGYFNLRMLVGFVYGFGQINGNELLKLRCLKNINEQTIKINNAAKATAIRNTIIQSTPGINSISGLNNSLPARNSNSLPPANNSPQKVSSSSPKIEQVESHTQKNGNPITSVVTSQLTSDTTRYHIYHNGEIKRQNASALSYAEFIYYDENGGVHNLGKSAYIRAPKRGVGNKVIGGNVYLVDQRKHTSYKKGDIGYKWTIESESRRYYLNGITMAATLGALMQYGYEEYVGSGWSNREGMSVGKSKTHRNGEAGDFRYLGKNGAHRRSPVHTTYSTFDMAANTKLVNLLRKFGFNVFYTGTKATGGVAKIKGTTFVVNHHHHLHIGGHSYAVKDI